MVVKKFFQKDNLKTLAHRFFPWTKWLFNYKIGDLRYDLIAGFTVGLTIIPQGMAYAQICTVNLQHGLYSSFVCQFVYALFGTSKDASAGPSAIVGMMVASFNTANPLIKSGDNTYSCLMAMISGLILVMIAVLKLGFIVNLFSIPVVSGFTSAAGLSIMASQLRPFFGLKDAPNDSPGAFVKKIINVFKNYKDIKIWDVAFGLSSIIFLMFAQYLPLLIEMALKKFNSRRNGSLNLTETQAKVMEYVRLFVSGRSVIVFIFATLASYLLRGDHLPEDKLSIVRDIPAGIPPPRFPNTEIRMIDNSTNATGEYIVVKTASDIFRDLIVSFVIVPMMIMLEMFAITKSLGRKNGYRIDATNELLAVGLGNFVQSFFQAFPVTVAVTRCALNDQCGVKTQLASIISGVIVIIALFALTPVFYYIPKAALAGIIIAAAYNLIDVNIIVPMWREYKPDVILLIMTFLLCLLFDMAYGILLMLLVNMITFLRPIVRMKMHIEHKRKADVDGKGSERITVVKLSHGMKYPSADKFLDRIARLLAKPDEHFVLDCQFFTGIDYTGLQALRGILLMAFKQRKHVIFTNMSDRLQRKLDVIGIDHYHHVDSVGEAIRHHHNTHDGKTAMNRNLSFVDIVDNESRSSFRPKRHRGESLGSGKGHEGIDGGAVNGIPTADSSVEIGHPHDKNKHQWPRRKTSILDTLQNLSDPSEHYQDIGRTLTVGHFGGGAVDESGSDDEEYDDDADELGKGKAVWIQVTPSKADDVEEGRHDEAPAEDDDQQPHHRRRSLQPHDVTPPKR